MDESMHAVYMGATPFTAAEIDRRNDTVRYESRLHAISTDALLQEYSRWISTGRATNISCDSEWVSISRGLLMVSREIENRGKNAAGSAVDQTPETACTNVHRDIQTLAVRRRDTLAQMADTRRNILDLEAAYNGLAEQLNTLDIELGKIESELKQVWER